MIGGTVEKIWGILGSTIPLSGLGVSLVAVPSPSTA